MGSRHWQGFSKGGNTDNMTDSIHWIAASIFTPKWAEDRPSQGVQIEVLLQNQLLALWKNLKPWPQDLICLDLSNNPDCPLGFSRNRNAKKKKIPLFVFFEQKFHRKNLRKVKKNRTNSIVNFPILKVKCQMTNALKV